MSFGILDDSIITFFCLLSSSILKYSRKIESFKSWFFSRINAHFCRGTHYPSQILSQSFTLQLLQWDHFLLLFLSHHSQLSLLICNHDDIMMTSSESLIGVLGEVTNGRNQFQKNVSYITPLVCEARVLGKY